MRYELYLRAADPPAELAGRILDALAGDKDLAFVSDVRFEHTGDGGTVDVSLHPAQDPRFSGQQGQGPLGVDLAIAGGAGEALASQLVELAFAWAKRWSLQVYDPQLGRTVAVEDAESIVARVKQHSDYLTDTVGLGEQSTRYMDVDVPAPRMGLRTRFYLILAAVLVLLGLAAHYCS